MKQTIYIALVGGLILFFSSCASIVSDNQYSVRINSTPSDANITIIDNRGEEVYSGTTPATPRLTSWDGFFGKAHYTVRFEKEGYETKTAPIEFSLDGWYFGNLAFGGLIGMLIIDPATGAMWKLDTEYIDATLVESSASIAPEIKLVNINDIPEEWKTHLVPVE